MYHFFRSITSGGALVLTALLTASSASAQPSAAGHVAAPGYRPIYSANESTLRVYPGDKGFHSTMQIEHYYQTLDRARSSAAPRLAARPRYAAVPVAPPASNVIVSIGEPANKPTLVDIRGPDGTIRSFPLARGNDVIRPRIIVLHPGDSLTIQFAGARAQAAKKP